MPGLLRLELAERSGGRLKRMETGKCETTLKECPRF